MKRTRICLLLLGPACLSAGAAEPPPTGDSLPVGDAAPPAVVRDAMADRLYDPMRMDRARALLAAEHGGAPASQVMGDLVEYTASSEGGGYRWDAEAWYGGDLHRFVLKTEGAGLRRAELGAAEAQALYSRAIGRYTDVQAGVRYELEPDGRVHAMIAVESLLPYWFEVEAALFVSERGDVFSRLEGHHDLRLTQRLILQPRAEFEIAGQDVRDIDIGSGVTSFELGLRLRYEIRREFAPYVGVDFERSVGRTADLMRAAGDDIRSTSLVLGVRGWF